MKRDYLKRGGAILLSVMVFVAFSVVVTPDAYAAKSKGKKYPVTSEVTNAWSYLNTYSDGEKDGESGKDIMVYHYDKNGLCTSVTNGNLKTVYTHNKKGYVTSTKEYDGNTLSTMTTYKVKKNGDVSSLKFYVAGKGFKTPYQTMSYTYWKKGVVKTTVNKLGDDTYKTWYDKKGNITKEVSSGKTTIWDEKKGDTVDGTYTETATYKNKLDKKGHAIKTTVTRVNKLSNGNTEKSTETITRSYKYKKNKILKCTTNTVRKNSEGKVEYKDKTVETNTYNKSGYLTKSTYEDTWSYSDGETYSNKSTSTIKYKRVKVAKKYRHLYKKKK